MSGSNATSSFGYQYDVIGNIRQWTQNQPGTNAAHPLAWANGYDAADQLRSSMITDTASNSLVNNYGYAYDSVGNRLSK